MSTLINFLLFSLSIFFCNTLIDISNTVTQKRRGLTKKPFLMMFNILPAYFSSFYFIILLFASTYLTQIFFVPLIIVLLTKITLAEKNYTYWVVKLSGVLPLAVFFISIKFLDNFNAISSNPFMILSYISAFIGVMLLNHDPDENMALNISRNIALNFIIIRSSYESTTFITAIIVSCIIFYLQFIILKIMPKLNFFEKARRCTILSVFISFVSFVSVLLWDFYTRG